MALQEELWNYVVMVIPISLFFSWIQKKAYSYQLHSDQYLQILLLSQLAIVKNDFVQNFHKEKLSLYKIFKGKSCHKTTCPREKLPQQNLPPGKVTTAKVATGKSWHINRILQWRSSPQLSIITFLFRTVCINCHDNFTTVINVYV